MGGGGQSAEAAIAGLKPYLVGHDPLQFEQLRWKIMNPVASLYNNRTQLHAALEFACMDVAGKKLGIRACDFLGGALREEVPFASYLFYRYRDPETGLGGETTPDEIVAHARDLVARYGFKAHKLKGGHFAPDHDVEVFRALGAAFPEGRHPSRSEQRMERRGKHPRREGDRGSQQRLFRGPVAGGSRACAACGAR